MGMGRRWITLLAVLWITCVYAQKKNRANCDPPDEVENAVLNRRSQKKTSFKHATHARYKCTEGTRTYDTDTRRICRNGKWMPPRFTCEWINCPHLQAPRNGQILNVNNAPNEMTNFSCDVGYEVIGQSVLRCQVGGSWVPESPPTCEAVTCPELWPIANGEKFQESPDGIKDDFGSVVTYTCNQYFDIEGPERRRCMADGQWEGDEPRCVPSSCPKFRPFDNGVVTYNKDPIEVATFAAFKCDPGADLIPDVTHATCMQDETWTYNPRCRRQLKLHQGIGERYEKKHSSWAGRPWYTSLYDRAVLKHEEEVRMHCYPDSEYELYRYGIFLNTQYFSSKNNDGVWDPELPSCKPKRCVVPNTYHGTDSYGDESVAQGKLLHGTDVTTTCDEGYEIKRGQTVAVNTCTKGRLYVPTCTEKPCPVPKDPPDFTKYSPWYGTVDHGRQVSVSCSNKSYELVTEDRWGREEYHYSYAAQCNLGQLDELAFCKEKRCVVPNTYHGTDSYGDESVAQGKLLHGTDVTTTCDEGYEVSRGHTVEVNTCDKGRLSAPRCSEKPCPVPKDPPDYTRYSPSYGIVYHGRQVSVSCSNASYELVTENSRGREEYHYSYAAQCNLGQLGELAFCKERRCTMSDLDDYGYDSKTDDAGRDIRARHIASRSDVIVSCDEGNQFEGLSANQSRITLTCDKGQFQNVIPCEPKPCFRPRVENAYNREAYKRIEHSKSITIECKPGYDLPDGYPTLDLTCQYGNFKPKRGTKIPKECNEKRCDLLILDDHKYMPLKDEDGDSLRTIASGDTLTATCKNGYHLQDNDNEVEVVISCDKGKLENDVPCQPRGCGIPDEVLNGVVEFLDVYDTGIIEHRDSIDIVCSEGFEITEGESSRTVTCRLGVWKEGLPSECIPKKCLVSDDLGDLDVMKIMDADGKKLSRDTLVDSGVILQPTCNKGFEPRIGQTPQISCDRGNWTEIFICDERNCSTPDIKDGTVYNWPRMSKLLLGKHVSRRDQIRVECSEGYKIEGSANQDEAAIFTCDDGEWDQPINCVTKTCHLTVREGTTYFTTLKGNVDEVTQNTVLPHDTEVSISCGDGFELTDDTNAVTNETSFSCNYGEFDKQITCEKEKCHLKTIDHGEVRLKGKVYSKPYIELGQQIKINCNKGYQIVMGRKIVSRFLTNCIKGNTLTRPLPTCTRQGGPKPIECRYPSTLKYSVFVNDTRVLNADYAEDGTKVEFVCKHGQGSTKTKCADGKWITEIAECEAEAAENTPDAPSINEPVTGCTLPTSNKYKFGDGALDPGEQVDEGSLTKVDCVSDQYDYYGDLYGTYDQEEQDIFLLCKDGELANFNESLLNCQEVLSSQCDQFNHGTVNDDYGTIRVECDKGYSLNIPSYDNDLKCEQDGLVTKRTDKTPECTPDDCQLPNSIRGMQLEMFPRTQPPRYLSGFQKIDHSTTILVNCTNGGTEPNNRKFKCEAAHWYDVEDEWDVKTHAKNWTEGAFPECRGAVCDPPCENGGVCIRDDKCRCLTGTEGKLCDRYSCPKLCTDNEGVCNTSNTCTCPNNKYGSYCEILLSEKCEKQLLNGRVEEDAGRISITCDEGYKLTTPKHDFMCENNVLLSVQRRIRPVCKSDGCKLPNVDVNIPDNMVKESYEPREEIRGLSCRLGHRLVGDTSLVCQEGGDWFGYASCERIRMTRYRIRVNTQEDKRILPLDTTATNANVYFSLHGEYGDSNEKQLTRDIDDYNKDLFEQGNADLFDEYFDDVGEINEIEFRLSSNAYIARHFLGWCPDVISMYDHTRHRYYRFVVRRWIKDHGGILRVKPNNDLGNRQCGDEFTTFTPMYVPKKKRNTTARDEIGCQLKCVEDRTCHGAVYHRYTRKCFWLNHDDVMAVTEPRAVQRNNEYFSKRRFCKS